MTRPRTPARRSFWACWLVVGILVACGEAPAPRESTDDTVSGEPSVATEDRRRVVVVVVDGARADRMPFLGYGQKTMPNLHALARQGLVFERHYAQATNVHRSLPSLLAGRYFADPLFSHRRGIPFTEPDAISRRPDDARLDLLDAFRAAGFETAGISTLRWASAETALARSFDTFFDLTPDDADSQRQPNAWQAVDEANRWLEGHLDDDFLLYLHLRDAHPPYRYGRHAAELFGDRPRPRGVIKGGGHPADPEVVPTGADREYLDALYDGSLREMDQQIGSLLNRLRQLRMYEGTLVVVVATNGQNLQHVPHRFAGSGTPYDAMVHVPLVIAQPGAMTPSRVDTVTENVDLVPTMLRAMDIPTPAGVEHDGHDLIALAAGEGATRTHAVGRGMVRDERYKLVVKGLRLLTDEDTEAAVAAAEGVLYDLETDPWEQVDVAASHRRVVERLARVYRERLRAPYERFTAARRTSAPTEPFAIAAGDFRFADPVARLAANDLESWIVDGPTGWRLARFSRTSAVVAQPGSGGLAIRIPVPDGRYELHAAASGVGRLRPKSRTDRGAPRSLESPSATRDQPWRARPQPLGVVTVEDGMFRAALTNLGHGPLQLHHLLFVPQVEPAD